MIGEIKNRNTFSHVFNLYLLLFFARSLNVKTHSKLLTFGSSTALLQGRRRPRPQKKTSMNDEQRYLAQVARATTTTTTITNPPLSLNPWPLVAASGHVPHQPLPLQQRRLRPLLLVR